MTEKEWEIERITRYRVAIEAGDPCAGDEVIEAMEEIIRCKDCAAGIPWKGSDWIECKKAGIRVMKRDGYCSWGEKLQEE